MPPEDGLRTEPVAIMTEKEEEDCCDDGNIIT
jgi:hypothetical protein